MSVVINDNGDFVVYQLPLILIPIHLTKKESLPVGPSLPLSTVVGPSLSFTVEPSYSHNFDNTVFGGDKVG